MLLGAGLAAVPGLQAQAADTATVVAGKSLVQQMRDEAQGSVAVSAENATGKIGFIRAGSRGDLMPSVKGDSLKGAVEKANAYLDRYAPAFGARASELKQVKVFSNRTGWTVAYTQSYKGVPVFGSMLKANVDRKGDLTSVNGYAAPGLDLSVTPRLSAAAAGERAVAMVRSNPTGEGKVKPSGLRATDGKLTIYRIGALRGEAGKSVLAWQVEVTNGSNVREAVLIDASTGKLLNRISLIHAFQTDRELYVESPDPENLIWKDGDEFPGTLDQEQQNLVLTSGNTYWLFANTFAFDSYDGEGAKMIMVNDYVDPDPAYCPNANWNGDAIRICEGTGPDDVVAHEWGHAYTEYTSGLIYQWQSGALNESYSDVWGETIDLLNNREDGDEGNLSKPRPDGQCSAHSPPSPLLTINSPETIAKECVTGGYLGPEPMPTVTGDVVAPTDADEDGDEEGATTLDGCSAYEQDVTGKVVLVNRGFCTFVEKAQMAKDEGASALIIGNRDAGPVGFSDSDQTLVPTVSIGIDDREAIRTALGNGETVNVTIDDASGTRADSYRWLMGEQSEAFGGAIRDMWNPTCHGDPGKVTDIEYVCSSDDSGGVHGNSGVPNHLYALAVDGGEYNGVTVPGMGLDKAANIWWLTQTQHLTPSSDFADMADGLEASCVSLIGESILGLELQRETPGSPIDPITSEDCQGLADAIAAVELRTDPTESCGWEPLLQPGNPADCGKGSEAETVFKEKFEDGLKGWKKSERVVDFGGATSHGIHWRASGNAPKHGSKVAFAPDPTTGSCAGDSDDLSSSNAITSKAISLMGKGSKSARMVFDHYMASEAGWDGGNVKLSVNGKKFEVVEADAYVFNAPNGHLFSAEEFNTSPMAGETAFTGTNDGESAGSWGVSQINLNKAGVSKGDTFKIRFDFGRDGCNGVDGWYVDNVKVVKCLDKGSNNKLATKQ